MEALSSQLSLEPGTILGKTYQIIRLIGRGGMGTVYMAYDTSLDLKVAIKLISPKIPSSEDTNDHAATFRRFQAEARIAAQIDHPNVIRILGFNRDTILLEDKSIEVDYLVMELLAERTLRDTMDESGFETEREMASWISKYMIPILDGLEQIHASGIIHRDIKPENFFLKEDKPKLADFGLSMGINQPSITESMVDIYGTLKYMAPEQFYNFKLAREPADIFSIGRILYEIVEGKISDSTKPFKQIQLTQADTPFLKELNKIILEATNESPKERLENAQELKSRLQQLIQQTSPTPAIKRRSYKNYSQPSLIWIGLLAIVFGLGIFAEHYFRGAPSVPTSTEDSQIQNPATTKQPLPLPQGMKEVYREKDGSMMHLLPSLSMDYNDSSTEDGEKLENAINAFYISESPVTNQQFVAFLNANLSVTLIAKNEVFIDGHLILKLSEKIRGYKPIVFDGNRFTIQEPMHSSCAVLMITGYGADAYSRYYGLRMVNEREWLSLKNLEDNEKPKDRVALPTPVINYSKNIYGIRGIDEIAEWGKLDSGNFAIMGHATSTMIEVEVISKKNPAKYYTDTSFRVAKDIVDQ